MASSVNKDTIGSSGVDVTEMENAFKKDKTRAKSNFTRSLTKLMALIQEHDLTNRLKVIEARKRLDSYWDILLDILTNFSDFYTNHKEHKKCERIVGEMERIEEDFYSASKAAREFLDSCKEVSTSLSSADMLTINLQHGLNIARENPETYLKEHLRTETPKETFKVQCFEQSSHNNDPVPTETQKRCETLQDKTVISDNNEAHVRTASASLSGCGKVGENHLINGQEMKSIGSEMNARAVPFEPRDQSYGNPSSSSVKCDTPSIGQDLWRQLKRVQIPVFSGDKKNYQSWKAAFLACIDSAPATGEYKLLQLRQYLSGEALKAIENLGHSAVAYEAAKERLERKFGGERRQIAIYIEELENFRQIRMGNAKDLEQFADLLDIAIINLQESNQHHELGNGSLYTRLQRKLPQAMVANFHRWIYDNKLTQSVTTLRKWVILESEFQTVASETVHGVTDQVSGVQTTHSRSGQKQARTFFGNSKDNRAKKTQNCQACGADHRIWACQAFKQKNNSERWDIAKRSQLCFRCLADGHSGKSCPRSRQCGLNGCEELHHRLLHRTSQETEQKAVDQKGTDSADVMTTDRTSGEQVTSGSEGNKRLQQTTMTASNVTTLDFIALRTVPVVLRNGGRSLKVNALLDDASTKTYVNADVAAELGLQGKTERVTVNVLNGQVETFDTRPVDVTVESVTGDAKFEVTAYTANRVTGTMSAFDWTQYAQRWPHLQRINFPKIAKRPHVDVLIGLDCADLHCAVQEVRGRPGEPIARLTPLGWTCIGKPGSEDKPTMLTHFARTYFAKDRAEIEQLNTNLKRFWEIDDMSVVKGGTVADKPIVRIEEQSALRKVYSI